VAQHDLAVLPDLDAEAHEIALAAVDAAGLELGFVEDIAGVEVAETKAPGSVALRQNHATAVVEIKPQPIGGLLGRHLGGGRIGPLDGRRRARRRRHQFQVRTRDVRRSAAREHVAHLESPRNGIVSAENDRRRWRARTYAAVTETQLNKFDLAPNIFDAIASRPAPIHKAQAPGIFRSTRAKSATAGCDRHPGARFEACMSLECNHK
jgi:hypothetical protein